MPIAPAVVCMDAREGLWILASVTVHVICWRRGMCLSPPAANRLNGKSPYAKTPPKGSHMRWLQGLNCTLRQLTQTGAEQHGMSGAKEAPIFVHK